MAATERIYFAVRDFILKKSLSILSRLNAMEMMVMTVERTKAPMAIGVALKTYFRSGR